MTSAESTHARLSVRVLSVALLICVIVAGQAQPASAAIVDAWFDFTRSSNTNSTLRWKTVDHADQVTTWKSWRAGSGENTNECDKSISSDPDGGWLPAGWYDVTSHTHSFSGSAIYGRVWQLNDKYCSDGRTLRTELFIHTEENSSGGQSGCDGSMSTDGSQCWDGPNDYYSKACIKVARSGGDDPNAPNDVPNVDYYWHNYNTSLSYPMTNALYVH